ncbi:MAG: DUF2752 domain-containing protein [Bacteroidetes bacterium]|nr:DUF2752 domain-containing protein [Bacteroidota bacterium]
MENHQLPCFFKSAFGIECPGCGTQRAFVFLLKGEFAHSFHAYPPLILFLSLIIFLSMHLAFKFRNGGIYLKYLFLFTVSAVLINFIYRLIVYR